MYEVSLRVKDDFPPHNLRFSVGHCKRTFREFLKLTENKIQIYEKRGCAGNEKFSSEKQAGIPIDGSVKVPCTLSNKIVVSED